MHGITPVLLRMIVPQGKRACCSCGGPDITGTSGVVNTRTRKPELDEPLLDMDDPDLDLDTASTSKGTSTKRTGM